MAKSSAKLNNYSGGIDLSTSERDIESNEFVDGTNVSVYRPGLLMIGHKAIINPEIPGLSFGTAGSGFHADGVKAFRTQKVIQFKHARPFGNCFAANYGAPLLGCTEGLGNYSSSLSNNTEITNLNQFPSSRGNKSTSSEMNGKYKDDDFITPAVTWVIGNELPKPSRNTYSRDQGGQEWCRWRYECGYDIKGLLGDSSYQDFKDGISDQASNHGYNKFTYPSAGFLTDDDEFADCAVLARPTRRSRGAGDAGESTATISVDGDSTFDIQPKMAVRFREMMSGPVTTKRAAPMNTNVTNNDFHATRLRPGTWYRMKIRYSNPTLYYSNTFGLAYDQCFSWRKDHETGGFQEIHNCPTIGKDLTGERCYDWLDPISYNNGDNPDKIKFKIKANKSWYSADIRFKTKVANYDDSDDWTRNLSSTYFCLCFSNYTTETARSDHSTLTGDFPHDESPDWDGTSNEDHKNIKVYIHHMKVEVDKYQDEGTTSDPYNVRGYEGNGDVYTMIAGKGESYGNKDSVHAWLHSRASGFWTEQSKFRNTHKLGLYPYDISGVQSGQDGNKHMNDWMPPIRYHNQYPRNEWQTSTSAVSMDSFYVNGALRLKNASTWDDNGVWFGYIDKEMYSGAVDYWAVYNKNHNSHWKYPMGAWWETGWYLLPKRFERPEKGRFTFCPFQLGVEKGLQKWKYPIDKKEMYGNVAANGGMYKWGNSNSDEIWGHWTAYFPQRDDMESQDWGPDYIESNGHDINVTMQFYAKGFKRKNSAGETIDQHGLTTDIDSYDEGSAPELQVDTMFGISYTYDAIKGEHAEFGHKQETAITEMTFPPYRIPDSKDKGDGLWHLNQDTFVWQAGLVTNVQPFRLHWNHGQRYHVANPRLTGFNIYLRQREDGIWADWFPMCEVNFVEGKYVWWGNGNKEEHKILQMSSVVQSGASHPGNAVHGNDSDVNASDDKFEINKNILFDASGTGKNWKDKAFTHSNTGGEWYRYSNNASKGYGTCPVRVSSADSLPVQTDGLKSGVAGEFWCTGVHAYRAIQTNMSYSERTHYEEGTVNHLVRYDCSTIAKSRVFIGNINDNTGTYPSRVIVTPKNKYDTFSTTEYIDYVGERSDDEIIELLDYEGKLIILKRYSVHIVSLDNISDLRTTPLFQLENNGIWKRYHSCEVTKGVCWFNKYGLFFFDGSKVHNLLKKEITVAEGVTVNKRRIDLETWGNTFDKQYAFVTYDATLEQIMIGSNTSKDDNNDKVDFTYDFTTKSFTKGINSFSQDYMTPPITQLETGKAFFFRHGTNDIIGEGDEVLPIASSMLWDDLLTVKTTTNVKLVTKDFDFRDPSRRKKFYKLYVTFKSNQYDVDSSSGKKPYEYCDNSKMKVYYALNGTRDWQDFDFTKSINYSDLGSSTSTEGAHGLVIWEDTGQAILEETLSATMSITANVFYLTGDVSKTVFAGMAVKMDDEVIVIDRVDDFSQANNRTKCYWKKRNINVENPNEINPTLSSHSSGTTVYVLGNNWTQATLIPKVTDTQRNAFYSIQFKVESVSLDDALDRRVPSRFSINDMSIIYREKYLK